MKKPTRANTASPSRNTRGSGKGAASAAQARRKVVVFASLLGALTFTSALLLALAPAPLVPGVTRSLFAIGSSQSIEDVFDTTIPVRSGHWKHIYIHHSATLSGDDQALVHDRAGLPDHFVIGNGDGLVDGELQTGQRWNEQAPAGLTPGLEHVGQDWISICVIGDFNRTRPTATQQRRLVQLVNVLQRRLGIRPDDILVSQPGSGPSGIGTYFPVNELRAQLLP